MADSFSPDLIFLSEPWLFQSDLHLATDLMRPAYKMFLNSDDLYDPDLPLMQTRAHSGTLTLWKAELDSYISVLKTHTSRVTGIVLDIPCRQTTVHINIYLPTAGKDSAFMEALAALQATIDEASELHPSALIFIKGDANASFTPRENNKRDVFFKEFCQDNSLDSLFLDNHKTYHHFTGAGRSDSNIDVLLFSKFSPDGTPSPATEKLEGIICSKEHDCLNSHHDAIISRVSLNHTDPPSNNSRPDVPTLQNERHKIVWSDDTIHQYQQLIQPVLLDLQDTWVNSSSPSSIAILLQQTNNVLTSAAKATQKVVYLIKLKLNLFQNF